MTNTKIARIAGVASIILAASAAMALPAQARSTAPGSTHGDCSAASAVKINASGKKDTITIKAKVLTSVAGEAWVYSISDNAVVVAAGDATTDKSGNFKVKASTANLDGTDTIDFTATNSVTAETCTAEVAV